MDFLLSIRSKMTNAGPITAEARSKMPDPQTTIATTHTFSVPFGPDSFEPCGNRPTQVRVRYGHGNFLRFDTPVYVHIDYDWLTIRWPAQIDFPYAHFPMRFVSFTVPAWAKGVFIVTPMMERDLSVREISEELRQFC